MTDKVLIRYRRRNGSSFAVLGNGWRYDGSSVIDATSDLELDLKLAQARYDDRWVTMEGNHVLIGGNGLIKAGVGGRLKGRKFGMRFKDYEHGKVSKNGKRLVRPYGAFKGKGGNTEPKKKTEVAPKKVTKATSNVVQGKNLLADANHKVKTYQEVGSKEVNNIFKEVTTKQGFRGLPKLVNKKDFEKAVENSGIVVYRGYTAKNKQIVDQYRKDLHKGDWYTDCNGGSMYGHGMYGAATSRKNTFYNPTEEQRKDAWREASNYASYGSTHIEAMTFTTDMKILQYGGKRGDNIQKQWLKEYRKNNPNTSLKQAKSEMAKRGGDVGTLAAELGYDAIIVEGMTSDYAVILNRTKCIILKSGADHEF